MAEGTQQVKRRPLVAKASKWPPGTASCNVCGDEAAKVIHFPQSNVVVVVSLCGECTTELRKQLK